MTAPDSDTPLNAEDLVSRYGTVLLGRQPLGEPPEQAAAWLRGRRVLITGAGGSVGRHLSAAVASAKPGSLLLLDHHETSLWELHRRFSRPGVELALADVRDQPRLRQLFQRCRPEIVFHLAAYKHVPFGEAFPEEVFRANVVATQALVALSARSGVERFVYPSSDKACDPPSLYGATKRLCELLVRQTNAGERLRYSVARFVNILGTQGSVIETFAQQVRRGQPLTITDPAMTRYWISMDEAVWLLLSAAALDQGGQTLLLDEQREITVVEMARRVCLVLRGQPDDWPIQLGSARPGERLREYLSSASESLEPGPRPGLLRACDRASEAHLAAIGPALARLTALLKCGDEQALRDAVMTAARVLQ